MGNIHDNSYHEQLVSKALPAISASRGIPRAERSERTRNDRVSKDLGSAAGAVAAGAAGARGADGERRLDVVFDLCRGRAERIEGYQQHEREVVGVRSVDAGGEHGGQDRGRR